MGALEVISTSKAIFIVLFTKKRPTSNFQRFPNGIDLLLNSRLYFLCLNFHLNHLYSFDKEYRFQLNGSFPRIDVQLTFSIEKCIIVTVIIVSCLTGIYFVENTHQRRESQLNKMEYSRAQQVASHISSQLNLAMQEKIYAAYALGDIYVSKQHIDTQALSLVSQNILNADSQIIAIGIAPNDVIEFAYPEPIDSSYFSQNFATPEATKAEVLLRQKNSEPLFSGTFYQINEAQGYTVLRSPIHTGRLEYQQYLGHVILVISTPKMLQDSGVYNANYRIALQDANNQQRTFGDESAVIDPLIVTQVEFAATQWTLYITQNHDSALTYWFSTNPVRLTGYTLIVIFLVLFGSMSWLYLQARQRSMQDELTQLPNRRYFLYTLKNLINNAKYSGTVFAVINLDLDEFKQVNDQYGHAAGDTLLKLVSERLRSTVRATDVVSRVGGDEFLIIVSRIKHEDEVVRLIEQIQLKVERTEYHLNGATIKISASIGYSIYQNKMTSFAHLLAEADINMYKNKALKRQLKNLRRAEVDAINALDIHHKP